MIKLQNVMILVQETKSPTEVVADYLKTNIKNIKNIKLVKRAVDARKKPNIFYCDTYLVELISPSLEKTIVKKHKNADFYISKPYVWKKAYKNPNIKPIIIGSGPAGLFAALTLAKSGITPIIIEQGEPVEQRVKTVEKFWEDGFLNEKSNVQFGEGGAGTFSDGKLNTGIKDPRCRTVLEEFNRLGASDDILINAKPHIGTDILRDVVVNIRKEIEKLGGKYYFNTEFIEPNIKNGTVTSVLLKSKNEIFELPCDYLILAIGNASRATYRTLYKKGINIIAKPFAIGVRIEHSQEKINISRYSKDYSGILPAADYKLATHLENGRGVYTFCMCPGGVVVNSSSENNSYVTNGMSYHSRNGKNSNSALLVGVNEHDFAHLEEGTPFGGVVLQENIERKAFEITKGNGAPIQNVGSFLNKSNKNTNTDISPTILPSYCNVDLDKIFPQYITESLKLALPIFDKQIKGFADDSAIITAPETRSSSPVRILRNDNYISNISGIFPCGEGAGYAGGITSSAVDGMRVAEAIIEIINNL